MAKRNRTNKKRHQKLQEDRQRAQRMRWIRIGGLILLVVVAFGAFVFYRSSTAPSVDTPSELMPDNVDGPLDAPVRIVEFGDFGCPSCRAWHNSGIKEALKSQYGESISFTFRHFPVITRHSPKAAEAGQCASEQGQFWSYHDLIYEQTPLGALSIDQLKSYAVTIGLDTGQFNQCLDSGKYASYVARDQEAAISAGARGTPTFFINGQPASFSFESMATKIDQLLQESTK